MTEEEAEAFEALPDFEALVALRKWDDGAKDEEIPADDSSYYKELCRKVLSEAWNNNNSNINNIKITTSQNAAAMNQWQNRFALILRTEQLTMHFL